MEGVRDTDTKLDSVVKSSIVGVSISVADERDEGRAGTRVKGGNRERGILLTSAGDGGIVLIRLTGGGGRRIEVSDETSIFSGSMRERADGGGRKDERRKRQWQLPCLRTGWNRRRRLRKEGQRN
jgi:hypothetical protein